MGISTTDSPCSSGVMTKPISPMSWYSGSQLTPTVSSALPPMPAVIAAALATRLAWVTSMPFGVPVSRR